MKKNSLLIIGILLMMIALSGVSVAQEAGQYAGRFSFSYPAEWTLTEGNDYVQVNSEGSSIIIYGPATYLQVIAGQTFDNDAAALAFFVSRVGLAANDEAFEAGPVKGELAKVRVELARRNQSGVAYLLDLNNGRRGVIVWLYAAETSPAAVIEVFGNIVNTLSYPSDIVDIAMANPDFSMLVAAVQAAGLVDTLRGGSYTVFAPTNAAFEAALARLGMTAEEAMADTEKLAMILNYHLVEGVVGSADLQPGKVTTVQGDPVVVRVRGGSVKVNNANVVAADIAAYNGVIHVIDAVLLPPDVEAPLISAQLPELLKIKKTQQGKYTFDYPVGIEPALNNDQAVLEKNEATVFIYGPTLYARVIGGTEQADDAAALNFFLERVGGYEVGDAITENLPANVLAATGVTLPRREQGGRAYLFDLKNNRRGVVVALSGRDAFSLAVRDYVENQVLSTLQYPPDLVDVMSADANFSLLVAAIQAAGLEDTLRDGEFTVFAPSNAAISAAVGSLGLTTEQLLENTDLLAAILNYHVIEGKVMSDALVAGDVATVNGESVTITLDDGPKVNGIAITTPDITAANGVIHAIDGVLVPRLCTVTTDQADTVWMRVGPGSERARLGFMAAGVVIDVTGQFTNEAGELWYQIDKEAAGAPSGAASAWVLSTEVTVGGAGCSIIPTVPQE